MTKEAKEIQVNISFKFNRDLLDIDAEALINRLPVFDESTARGGKGYAKVFRMFPLTEIEARSLRFTTASPVVWIENHVLDLIRLQAFEQGYDARTENIKFVLNYVDSWVQEEYSVATDGVASTLEAHVYRWSHDRTNNELVLTDNGQEIVRARVRGPQSYTELAIHEEESRKHAVEPNRAKESERGE